MTRDAIARTLDPTDRIWFRVLQVPNTPRCTGPRLPDLVARIRPGDTGQSILTIVLLVASGLHLPPEFR